MKKKKLNTQRIFNIISFVFIITCVLFYGTRFIMLYTDNKKQVTVEANTLGKEIKEKNKDILKNINNNYYFNGNVDNNYVKYSNILWRIIKVSDKNAVTLISNNNIVSLAHGNNKDYVESYINTWLNKNDLKDSGILENNLNSMITYLKHNELCLDKIDNINNNKCSNINSDYFITSLDINDYIHTGASDSFINTKESFYLVNNTTDNKSWYVNQDGKLDKGIKDNIMGIKPVITTKDNLELVSGNGTKDNPYIIEKENGLLGSYVKLDNDLWQIIDSSNDKLKLIYSDYLKKDNDYITLKYSNYSSKYEPTRRNTLAYYLNNTYLNKLSYKDIILEEEYANGYYGKDNNYDYTKSLENTIKTKIALTNITDININNNLYNYFTMTKSNNKNNFLYTVQRDGIPYSKIMSTTSYVVPVITINNNIEGDGTIDNPYKVVDNND